MSVESVESVESDARETTRDDVLIDSQIHVVSPDRHRYPLDPPPIQGQPWFERYGRSAEELVAEMDTIGVARAVLVQAYTAYRFDNRYTVDSAARWPDRFVCSCIIDIADDPLSAVRYWIGERSARGIRLFLQIDETGWLDTRACDAVLDDLEARGVVAQMIVHAQQYDSVLGAAMRHPGLPMLVDHCGYPDLSGGPGYPNAGGLFALAGAGNVYLKLSTQVFRLAHDAGVDRARFTKDLVETFGASRVMWASDLTVQPRSYLAVVDDARKACSGLSTADEALVMAESAAALWWPSEQ